MIASEGTLTFLGWPEQLSNTCTYVRTYVCMYVCMYVRIYVRMYLRTYALV